MGKRGGVPENLRPPRTSEEAQKRGRNGGIKSGEARRRKSGMKYVIQILMDMPVSFENIREQMKSIGIDDENLTNQMAIAVSMFKEAMAGNVKAAEFLRDTVGDDDSGEIRREKLRIDRERLNIEKKRLESELSDETKGDDGMPTIINVRPNNEK